MKTMFKRFFVILISLIRIAILIFKIKMVRIKKFFRKLVLFKCTMVNRLYHVKVKKWYKNPEKYKKQIIETSIMVINQVLPPGEFEIKYKKRIKMLHIIHKKEGYEIFVSPNMIKPFVSEIYNYDERILYLIERMNSNNIMEKVMKLAGDQTKKYLKAGFMCRGANLIRSNLILFPFDEMVEYLGIFYNIIEIE